MRMKPDLRTITNNEEEWLDWYRLSPRQRWNETSKLWDFYLAIGGSLEPEPDSQSPFSSAFTPSPLPSHGRPGVRAIRRV